MEKTTGIGGQTQQRRAPLEIYANIFNFIQTQSVKHVLLSRDTLPEYYLKHLELAFLENRGSWFSVLNLLGCAPTKKQLKAFLTNTVRYWGVGGDQKMKLQNNVLIYLLLESRIDTEILKMMLAPPPKLREKIDVLSQDGNWTFNPGANSNLALRTAVGKRNKEAVKMLIDDDRVDPSAALGRACYCGYIDVVSILLQNSRVDPSDNGNYAIRWASQQGHANIVELLLKDSRVAPSAISNHAIRGAAEHGRFKVVSLLLKDGRVDPSAMSNSAIRGAAQNGHTEIVQMLLNNKCVNSTLSPEDKLKYQQLVSEQHK